MDIRDQIQTDYFEWMSSLVCGDRYSENISYRKLLTHLHDTDFDWIIPMDANRANDGEELRYRYALQNGVDEGFLNIGPCSILEMMVALSLRIEEEIMDDPDVGNRTSQWFWDMVATLGLGGVTDDQYDRRFVDDILYKFLLREYDADGRGGLFRIRNPRKDLRHVEIWHQTLWYLNGIV